MTDDFVKTSFVHFLRERLSKTLPGEDIQNLMAPLNSKAYRQPGPDPKVACVVLLVHFYLDKPFITFIQRASHHPRDKHRGQISFPGGKMDEGDHSLEFCALRELHEELGILPDNIHVLGQLTPLYVYVSDFLVYPFVAMTQEKPRYTPHLEEVSHVFEFPLEYFFDNQVIKTKNIEASGRVLENTPYYDLQNHVLWGASAMILSEFLHLVEPIVIPRS